LIIKNKEVANLKRFNKGDVVYFVSSSVFIKKATLFVMLVVLYNTIFRW